MITYPKKILLAWSQAISGNEKIAKWLLENGYPELICVIDFLWGSTKAGEWFKKNKLLHWRAFCDYLGDEDPRARAFLEKSGYELLALLGDAVHEKKPALMYFNQNGMTEMSLLAQSLNKLLYNIEFDTNMIYRSPI